MDVTRKLDILYHDDHLIAINKPHGLLVHKTRIAADVEDVALQRVRDQIGQYVYPVHRLDRKTSGVLLFAKDRNTHKVIHQSFMGASSHQNISGYCARIYSIGRKN